MHVSSKCQFFFKMSTWNVFVGVALVLCVAEPSCAVDYPVYDLGAFCDQTITIPCPYATAQAGTLKFLQRPLLYCSVEFKLADNCGSCIDGIYAGKYALYFNFRNFTKYPTDTVYFRKSKLLGTPVKQLTGSVNPTNNPPSVAQYKTDLATSPNLFIEYMSATSIPVNTDPIEVIIDFVVLEFTEQAHSNVYCVALAEYVHRDLICDTTDNRINCPESYREGSGFNAADDRQCSDPLPPPPDVFNATYPIFDIEQRCSDVITIPCPTEGRGRSGRLQFNNVPKSTCQVTVQLESNCTSSAFDSFAIYLNMKQMNVIPRDNFLIYENMGGNRTLRKELTTGINNTATTSVAHFVTEYGEQPRVDLVYNRTSTVCFKAYKIAIDYTVLHGSSLPSSQSTYCAALDGFVHNDLLCTAREERLNCPDRYEYSMFENPAQSVQCTAEEGTPYEQLYLEEGMSALTVPCPTSRDGRVGTLYSYSWHYENVTTFSVNFSLPSGCGSENETFAFYFNIRSLTLVPNSSLTFSKKHSGDTQMQIEKHFAGPLNETVRLSVDQYLTPFEKQASVILTITYGDDPNGDSGFDLNYAVYSKENDTGKAYCPALNAFIKEDLLCDTDGSSDRINCPSSYNSSTSVNPATARYCTKPRTTLPPTTTTSRSTTARTTTRSTSRITTRSTTGRTTTRTSTTRRTSTTWKWTTPWSWWDTTRWPVYPTETTDYWWQRTTDMPWYTPATFEPAYLSGGAIAGIVIGVVAGVALLIVVVVLLCRRSPAPSKMQPPVSYTTNPNVQAPVVVGHAPQGTAPYYAPNQPMPYSSGPPAPYPTGQPLPYPAGQPMQAPPSYAAVAQGAHPTHPVTHS